MVQNKLNHSQFLLQTLNAKMPESISLAVISKVAVLTVTLSCKDKVGLTAKDEVKSAGPFISILVGKEMFDPSLDNPE